MGRSTIAWSKCVRRLRDALVYVCCYAVWCGAQGQPEPPDWGHVPLRCRPGAWYTLYAKVSNDRGGIEPDALVTQGETVKLWGSSTLATQGSDCKIGTKSIPWTWLLTFQSRDALPPKDVSVNLDQRSTLTPTFVAAELGTYLLSLKSAYGIRQIRIDSVERPVTWVPIGPFGYEGVVQTTDGPQPQEVNVGRVNVLAFDSQRPATIYAGSSQGGVFRSLDAGKSWWPISDHTSAPAAEVTALLVAGDSNLYVGVGHDETDRQAFLETQSGVRRLNASTHSWEELGAATTTCPMVSQPPTGRPTRIISKGPVRVTLPPPGGQVLVTPFELVVATDNGLYVSDQAASCWRRVLTGAGEVSDVAYDPFDRTALIAGTTGMGIVRVGSYRTTPTVTTSYIPFGAAGARIRLAAAKSRVYAMAGQANSIEVSSTFDGKAWTKVSSPGSVCSRQCNYWPAWAVDPSDDTHVYFAAVNIFESTDSGVSFSALNVQGNAHVDFHNSAFVPSDPSTVFFATDGGIYSLKLGASRRPLGSWIANNRYLNSNQSATAAIAPSQAGTTLIGAWDNGELLRESGRAWRNVWPGDGEGAAIDATNSGVYYAFTNAGQGSSIVRVSDGVTVATAAGYATNPYKGGELWAIGKSGRFYVSQDAATATSPTWRCADPATSNTSGPFSIDFASDGHVFVGYWDGTVIRMTVPDPTQGSSDCTTSAAREMEAVAPVLSGSGLGAGLSVGASADEVFVSRPAAAAAERISRYNRSGTGTWGQTALADTLPAEARNALSTAIAQDLGFGSRVHVGTKRGLYTGVIESGGTVNWQLDRSMPDVWVSSFARRKTGTGVQSELRASSYGRGTFERRWFPRPCSDLGACSERVTPRPTLCISCVASQVAPQRQSGPAAMIAVVLAVQPQEAASRQAIEVEARCSGLPCRGVRTRAVHWDQASGDVVVELLPAALDMPLGVVVDSVHLVVIDEQGRKTANETMNAVRLPLVRPDARLLSVMASQGATYDGGAVKEMSVKANTPAAILRLGPGLYAARLGARIAIAAPPKTGNDRHFESWSIAGQQKSQARRNSLTFTVEEDAAVTATYEGEEEGGEEAVGR